VIRAAGAALPLLVRTVPPVAAVERLVGGRGRQLGPGARRLVGRGLAHLWMKGYERSSIASLAEEACKAARTPTNSA
jgi:hypothetical protein